MSKGVGTEEDFQKVMGQVAKICKQYEQGEIKYVKYAECMDSVFTSYNWSKTSFYQELDRRLGRPVAEEKPKKVKTKRKRSIKKKDTV